MTSSPYSRFWLALGRLPRHGLGTETLKCDLVLQYTSGRTAHLHEMTAGEYDQLCRSLESRLPPSPQSPRRKAPFGIRKLRSRILVEMRRWGVAGVRSDSVDWQSVDAFCRNPRIAGAPFRELDEDALAALLRKLICMNGKKSDDGAR